MDPGYASYPRRGPSTGSVVFVSIFTSIIASAGTVALIERFDLVEVFSRKRAGSVEVPELTTMKRQQADEVLRTRGLRLVVSGHREDPAPEGTVVEQTPMAGSRVNAQDGVTVTLSAGNPQVPVPMLVTKTQDAARAMLEQAGLVVGEIRQGGSGEPGAVTGTDPAPGTSVAPGIAVALTVAAAAMVEVPELIDMNIRTAKTKIAEAQLAVGKVKERYNRRKRGNVVLKQEPAAGTEVTEQTEINLIVNQGDY